MSSFRIKPLGIKDVLHIRPKIHIDNRGLFFELFKKSDFAFLDKFVFVQDNVSVSNKDVIRGLHFQRSPKAQGKLITVLKGRIFDVAVDIRPKSSTFGKYVSCFIDSVNYESIYIPEGFAHGFCAMEDDTIIMYKNTTEYSKEREMGIFWNDPILGIEWPCKKPILSDKDKALPLFSEISEDILGDL